jgi:hypothetical protein
LALHNLTEGLAASEIERLEQLVEGIEFDEHYDAKINQIRESHFNKPAVAPKVLAEDKKIVGTDPVINETAVPHITSLVRDQIKRMNSFGR